MIYTGLVVFSIGVGPWIHPIMFRMPLLAMTSALSVWLTAVVRMAKERKERRGAEVLVTGECRS